MKSLVYTLPLVLSVMACSYVGSQNTYEITDTEHQLLYNSASSVSYTYSFEGDVEVTSGEESLFIPIMGTGAVGQEADEPIPDLQLVTEIEVENEAGQTGNFQLEFRLVDNQVYLQSTNLQTGAATDWASMSMGDLFVGVGLDLPTGVFDFGSTTDPFIGSQVVEAFDSSLGETSAMELSEHTDILRRSDDTSSGAHQTVFEIRVDEYEFLTANISAMLPLIELLGLSEDFGPMDQALLEMLAGPLVEQLLPTFEWDVIQRVNTETGNQAESKTSIYIEIASVVLASLTVPEQGGAIDDNLGFEVYLDTRYDDYDENIEIAIPDEAVPMTFEAFLTQTQAIAQE